MNLMVKKLAELSGVTIRTLRFYDEIGLLKPAYVSENGYRYYVRAAAFDSAASSVFSRAWF